VRVSHTPTLPTASPVLISSLSVLIYLTMIGVSGTFITGGLGTSAPKAAPRNWVPAHAEQESQASLVQEIPARYMPPSAGYVSLPLLG
jgi:hypothetical protein